MNGLGMGADMMSCLLEGTVTLHPDTSFFCSCRKMDEEVGLGHSFSPAMDVDPEQTPLGPSGAERRGEKRL